MPKSACGTSPPKQADSISSYQPIRAVKMRWLGNKLQSERAARELATAAAIKAREAKAALEPHRPSMAAADAFRANINDIRGSTQ